MGRGPTENVERDRHLFFRSLGKASRLSSPPVSSLCRLRFAPNARGLARNPLVPADSPGLDFPENGLFSLDPPPLPSPRTAFPRRFAQQFFPCERQGAPMSWLPLPSLSDAKYARMNRTLLYVGSPWLVPFPHDEPEGQFYTELSPFVTFAHGFQLLFRAPFAVPITSSGFFSHPPRARQLWQACSD